jgi:exosortase
MNTPTTNATTTPDVSRRPGSTFWLALGAPLVVLTWAYWPNLAEMAHAWSHNAECSHGYLVPMFAAFLLWLRRDRLDLSEARPAWVGMAFIGVAVILRGVGTYYFRVWLDHISLLACLAGLCLLLGGWSAFRWSWPAILFLFFMIPLPFSVANGISGPLQSLATLCSTFLLQTLGLPALSEGNIIRINDAQIAIAEACSGLKMLVVFFALSTGMALVTKSPLPDKLVMVASAIPIALISNIIRITITGLMHELVNSEAANVFFHDVAGWFMMPLALGLLWLELKILSKLFVPAAYSPGRPQVSNRKRPAAPPRTRPARVPGSRSTRRPAPPAPPASEPAALNEPPAEPVAPQGAPA